MSRALVLLSGGIDSAVAHVWAKQNYSEVEAITFNYHLRPFRERLAVYRLLQDFRASLIEVPVGFLREATDTKLFNAEVPEGYIPNRNMIFYSIASYYAELHACTALVGGHIGVDAESFPDASPKFFEQLSALVNQALLVHKLKIELPLSKMPKSEVMKKALEWKVPFESTWSCYWDADKPCGKCVSCTERAEAFNAIGVRDPLSDS
ncbi:MAG TPA: 7-cyano-7-deazaguanine synthase [Acidobacteriota bacterium]|nr:7-cyano-7-deazaguanine synthase [Acidobacteriota bacterium]